MKRIALAIVGIVILGGIVFWASSSTEYVQVEKEVIVNDFDYRVEVLMASTSQEWSKRHKDWAETQIHLEDIEHAEAALNELGDIEEDY